MTSLEIQLKNYTIKHTLYIRDDSHRVYSQQFPRLPIDPHRYQPTVKEAAISAVIKVITIIQGG